MKKIFFLISFLIPNFAFAQVHEHGADHPQIFHAFILEADAGESREGSNQSWDLSGWVGGDYNRLWIRSEGEVSQGKTEHANLEMLYSRNIAQFWDAQIGVRRDFREKHLNYLEFGFEGLAPYSFETEFHGFVSEDGDLSFRLKQEVDVLITQRLIFQPYFETYVFASDVANQNIKSGMSEFEIGALTRYEISRKFAPYFALRYHTKTFSTKDLAKKRGDEIDDFIASVGIRFRF